VLTAWFAVASIGCAADLDESQSTEEPSPPVAQTAMPLAGKDGAASVSSPNTNVNRYTTLAQNAAQGARTLQLGSVAALSDGSDALGPGDLLLVIQMQGATINTTATSADWGAVTSLGGAGRYELVEVGSVNASAGAVTLSCALVNSYDVTGNVQVIRVPQYTSLAIAAGASITAPPWNGATGGVVAIHARSTVQLDGAIEVSGLGFRGGPADNASAASTANMTAYASATASAGGRKGEGIAGLLALYGRGAAANGGGGGNAHNAGGGGGANGRRGAAWTGQGVFDLTVPGGDDAWPLDPNFSATASQGGGRGGYTFSNDDRNATVLGPENALWLGNLRRQRGGLGGRPVDNDPGSRLFVGGGGGAGDGNNQHAGRGGNGGGLVILVARTVAGSGQIRANGEPGVSANSITSAPVNGDAPGGGGGGGTIVVQAASVQGISAEARGGAGGSQFVNNLDEAEGPGGGGGGGYVASTASISANVSGGASGTTNSPALTEFPANGATRGGDGQAEFGSAVTADLRYCADEEVPDTTIVTRPTNPTSDTTGGFVFESPGDPTATFECRVDAAAFATCPRNFTTAALAPGSHTLQVRARDAVGNVDSTPATYTWVIDTRSPETTIVSRPTNPTTDPTGDFTFTSDEANVTFQCSVDGAAFSACNASFSTAALTPGSHTLRVRARDAAGNVDTTPAQYTWQVQRGAADSDGDGLNDTEEGAIGTNPNDRDTDDDGVSDGAEASPGVDSDEDGLVNALDADSDNDGIFDGTEMGVVTPGVGTDVSRGRFTPDRDPATTTDPLDADTDGGGLDDGSEDPNHDGRIDSGERNPNNPADDINAPTDTDRDGLQDGEETAIGTNPADADSDDDGVSDGAEPNPTDDSDGDGLITPLDPDSDNDGLFDGTELGLGCNNPATDLRRRACVPDADRGATKTLPLDPDTDDGGVRDGAEDGNGNGVVDAGEIDPTAGHGADDRNATDTDDDGLTDSHETAIGSKPNDADTDDDGLLDGEEPNPTHDRDSDGLIGVLDPDSDDDGLFDGTESRKNCSHPATDTSQNYCRPDADSATTTFPLARDSDRGSVTDGSEDSNLQGKLEAGERNPVEGNGADDVSEVDSDRDGLSDSLEATLGSNRNDADSDDDGLLDGDEANPSADHDKDGKVGVLDPDSDGDGLFDGTETGRGCNNPGTDTSKNLCIADADPTTRTAVLLPDTDGGGATDGDEDANKDGKRDGAERNPLDGSDDDVLPPDGGTAGAAGTAGTAGTAGSSGSGGAGGSQNAADEPSVVLGGGLCAHGRPLRGSCSAGAIGSVLWILAVRRRRNRPSR
jgi:hypothetical protein